MSRSAWALPRCTASGYLRGEINLSTRLVCAIQSVQATLVWSPCRVWTGWEALNLHNLSLAETVEDIRQQKTSQSWIEGGIHHVSTPSWSNPITDLWYGNMNLPVNAACPCGFPFGPQWNNRLVCGSSTSFLDDNVGTWLNTERDHWLSAANYTCVPSFAVSLFSWICVMSNRPRWSVQTGWEVD